jgi:hypothetical protein
MARPITRNKEEYEIARRDSYISKRRAVDPKLDRQLKDIEGQSGRRGIKSTKEYSETPTASVGLPGGGYVQWDIHERQRKKDKSKKFAESEKKKRINKALAKSRARSKK